MKRILLTDPLLKSMLATKPDKQTDTWDSVVEGLSARHNLSGSIAFTVVTRLPNAKQPTRRTIGTYAPPLKAKKTKAEDLEEQRAAESAETRARIAKTANPMLSLAEARVLARDALALMEKGVDPKVQKAAETAATERSKAIKDKATLRVAIDRYIDDKVMKQRRGQDVANALRKQLVSFWIDENRQLGDLPVADVDDELIMKAVSYIQQHGGRDGNGAAPAAAKLLGRTKTAFKYIAHTSAFGIKTNPISEKSPNEIAESVERDRVMEPYELRWFWKATQRLEAPFREYYQLLIMTGQRRQQVAGMADHELKRASDLPRSSDEKEAIPADALVWVLEPSRMKADAWHYLPLPSAVARVIDDLPRLPDGPHLFSGTSGARPVSGFSKSKVKLDAAMLAVAQEEAVAAGKDPKHVSITPWRPNDLRRTFRTMIGELDVADHICEQLIAHTTPTQHRTYARGKYLRQKLDAMELWTQTLDEIVNPPPQKGHGDNIVKLPKRGSR